MKNSAAVGGRPTRTTPGTPLTMDVLLDLFTRAIWTILQRVDADHRWTQQAGLGRHLSPDVLLDAVASALEEASFPYPNATRYDSVGGARKIAPDGSPGVPAQWLRYIARDAHTGAETHGAHGPLLAAMLWVARAHPDLWRVYEARVFKRIPLAELARHAQVTPSTITRRLARARMLLLARLAYLTGDATPQEYALILRQMGLSTPSPRPPQKSDSLRTSTDTRATRGGQGDRGDARAHV